MDSRLIILLGIVLLIYVLTNYYIYIHIAPLCLSPRGKILIPLLLLIMAAYPVGRILQAFISPGITIKIIIAAGSYYLAFMAYAFFLVLFMDIYRPFIFIFLPSTFRHHTASANMESWHLSYNRFDLFWQSKRQKSSNRHP